MALIYAMLLGADCIDDSALLRAGARAGFGRRLPAPSTLGTFLRAFTFGHVRQLDRVLDQALRRAWRSGAGPGYERLVVDVDSFVGEVHGYREGGSRLRVHEEARVSPDDRLPRGHGRGAARAAAQGQAASPRGVVRFVDELIARVRRAGAVGEKLLRADSAFWNNKLIARLENAGWRYSISVRLQLPVKDALAEIPESAWTPLQDYPADGEAQIAETTIKDKR